MIKKFDTFGVMEKFRYFKMNKKHAFAPFALSVKRP